MSASNLTEAILAYALDASVEEQTQRIVRIVEETQRIGRVIVVPKRMREGTALGLGIANLITRTPARR